MTRYIMTRRRIRPTRLIPSRWIPRYVSTAVLIGGVAIGDVASARDRKAMSLLAPNTACGSSSSAAGQVLFERLDSCTAPCTVTVAYHVYVQDLTSNATSAGLRALNLSDPADPVCATSYIAELDPIEDGIIQISSDDWNKLLLSQIVLDLHTEAYPFGGAGSELRGTPGKGPPGPLMIPTTTAWGMVALTLLLLAAGTVALRRRSWIPRGGR